MYVCACVCVIRFAHFRSRNQAWGHFHHERLVRSVLASRYGGNRYSRVGLAGGWWERRWRGQRRETRDESKHRCRWSRRRGNDSDMFWIMASAALTLPQSFGQRARSGNPFAHVENIFLAQIFFQKLQGVHPAQQGGRIISWRQQTRARLQQQTTISRCCGSLRLSCDLPPCGLIAPSNTASSQLIDLT